MTEQLYIAVLIARLVGLHFEVAERRRLRSGQNPNPVMDVL